MTNTLITGGSGLLGSALTIKNSFKPNSNELDLLNYSMLSDYIESNKISSIIHCAARVGGVHANTKWIYEFFDDNLVMNLNILRACRDHKIDNSIFILSTCILPADGPFPLTEEFLHLGEPHFTNYGYAYAKRMLEVGARCLKDEYGIRSTCIIPCNFYGSNDNYDLVGGHVIPSIIHKCYLAMQNNTDLEVWGSGLPEREFIFVKDLSKVIETVHLDQILNTKEYPQTMIVSSGQSCSIREIVNLIISEMGFTGNIIFDKTKPDGILRKPTSNVLFEKNFSDFCWTDMKEGIKKSVNYFKQNYPNIRK